MKLKKILFCKHLIIKLILLVSLIFLSAFLSNYPIKLIEYLVDLATKFDNKYTKEILLVGSVYLFMQVLRAFLTACMKYMSDKIQQDIGVNIQNSIYNHLIKADLISVESNRVSNITNILIEDSEFIIKNLLTPLTTLIFSIVSFFIGLYFMITINVLLPFLIIPLGLVTAIVAKIINDKSSKNIEDLRDSSQNLWKTFEEGIRGILPIKIFRYSKDYQRKVELDTNNMKKFILKQSKLDSLSYFALSSLFMITIGGILIISSIFVVNGYISLGGLTAIMMYNHLLVDPLVDSLQLQQSFIKLKISLKRINKIFDMPIDKMYSKRKVDINSVILKNVSFSYNNTEVLKNINLNLSSNYKVAIVGHTGSGKSTLAKIIVGLYPVSKGECEYYYNGNKTEGIPKVSYLVQDGYLFDVSIKENIKLFNNQLSDTDFRYIAKISGVDSIEKVYSDENIGDNGKLLSGGEKKRVEIARTLAYKEASMYIFDELTSSLDNAMANNIMDNIFSELKDKLCIFIEHNLEYTKNMDLIIVMKSGEIVELGTYDELVSKKGYFYSLINN